ncbi:MAG: pyruvate dehydrogenase (acetyl-transferring) E1 component subunit alpha [Alphaproteobacteria bacterium]
MNAAAQPKAAETKAKTTRVGVVEGGAVLPHEVLGLSVAQLEQAYRTMVYARRFEEKAASLYQNKEIQGFCHLAIGQEATTTGTKLAAGPMDDFITSYRCHNMALDCGLSGDEIMAELTGRATGISKGKGGSMHMFEPSKHFWGGHGIVAAQVPLGVGLAFAAKYRGETDRVAYVFMGDGAMNAGQVFEAFNMAALWQLPVVFVIENNKWGMGTSVARAAAGNLVERGTPFGIRGETVDGMDLFAVVEAVRRARAEALTGKPVLLEFDTYRYRGHSMSDPAKYRTRDDVEGVREARDPIVRLETYLKANFKKTSEWFEDVDESIKTEVNAVAERAVTAPYPDASELWTDVVPE